MPARHPNHAVVEIDGDTQLRCHSQQRQIHALADINDRGDTHPGAGQREDIVPAAIVRGHQRHLLAHRHPIAPQESPRGRREHHPGHIVAREH